MNARQLLENLLSYTSHDEMRSAIQDWLRSDQSGGKQVIYAVFAAVRGGVSHDWLAAYSTRNRAQHFISAQDERLRDCLVIWEVEIDRQPSDDYWRKPDDLAGAFHVLAELPADALPEDRAVGEQERLAVPEYVGAPHEEAPEHPMPHLSQLARLASGLDHALVCGVCGREISQLAGYVEQSPLGHTHAPGTCDVCGRAGSVSPSDDWIGEGD